METEKRPRRLNPRTIALLRKRISDLGADAPDVSNVPAVPAAPPAEAPKATAPSSAQRHLDLGPRPLALLPITSIAPAVTSPKPPSPKPFSQRSTARNAASLVGIGATPLLPGLGLNPAAVPKPPPVKKSVLNDDFARLSVPDAPLTDVIIVDTETTGSGVGARLVELGALHVRDGKVVAQFQTLVDPEEQIPAYVIRIHGITNAMVKGAPRAKLVLPAFLAFVGNRCLMAHNAGFDRGIIAQELQRVGMKRPDIPMFCSLKLARKVFPQAPNHKLSTLASYLKIPDPPSHRAIADCMTTVGVLAACASRHPLRTLHVVHGGVVAL